jgi:hypothetical protein
MTKPEDAAMPAVGSPVERVVMPLSEYEKELARLLAQRKRIDQRRDAVQAQITTIRNTIADIDRARKAAEDSKISRPWQVKFMRATPATSGRDIAMLVQYLTTPATFSGMGRERGISGGRVAQAVWKVVRLLKHPQYWPEGVLKPPTGSVEELRANADAWLSALRRAEERHNVGVQAARRAGSPATKG